MKNQTSLPKKKFKLFLGGIHPKARVKQIYQHLSSYYPSLSRVEIPVRKEEKRSKKNKGFAILHLKSKHEYEELLAKGFFDIKGRKMIVRTFLKGDQLRDHQDFKSNCRIFLPHIPDCVSEKQLKVKLESKFGSIEDSYKLKHPETGAPRCCGHVFFKHPPSAAKAIKLGELKINGVKVKINKYRKQDEEAVIQQEELGQNYKMPSKVNSPFRKSSTLRTEIICKFDLKAIEHWIKPVQRAYRDSLIGLVRIKEEQQCSRQNYKLNVGC